MRDQCCSGVPAVESEHVRAGGLALCSSRMISQPKRISSLQEPPVSLWADQLVSIDCVDAMSASIDHGARGAIRAQVSTTATRGMRFLQQAFSCPQPPCMSSVEIGVSPIASLSGEIVDKT